MDTMGLSPEQLAALDQEAKELGGKGQALPAMRFWDMRVRLMYDDTHLHKERGFRGSVSMVTPAPTLAQALDVFKWANPIARNSYDVRSVTEVSRAAFYEYISSKAIAGSKRAYANRRIKSVADLYGAPVARRAAKKRALLTLVAPADHGSGNGGSRSLGEKLFRRKDWSTDNNPAAVTIGGSGLFATATLLGTQAAQLAAGRARRREFLAISTRRDGRVVDGGGLENH